MGMRLVNVALITVVRKTQMREELICSVHWHYMPVRPQTLLLPLPPTPSFELVYFVYGHKLECVYWDTVWEFKKPRH
jgi:hypothetical protein